MDEYDCYANIIKSILEYSKNEKYNTIIPIFLNKMYYEYYIYRNLKNIIWITFIKNICLFYILH